MLILISFLDLTIDCLENWYFNHKLKRILIKNFVHSVELSDAIRKYDIISLRCIGI